MKKLPTRIKFTSIPRYQALLYYVHFIEPSIEIIEMITHFEIFTFFIVKLSNQKAILVELCCSESRLDLIKVLVLWEMIMFHFPSMSIYMKFTIVTSFDILRGYFSRWEGIFPGGVYPAKSITTPQKKNWIKNDRHDSKCSSIGFENLLRESSYAYDTCGITFLRSRISQRRSPRDG